MRIIYTAKEFNPVKYFYELSTAFTPVFDYTDRLHFICPQCKEIAIILRVKRDDSYTNSPTIYFFMQCPKCKNCGVRKICLEDIGKHDMVYPVEVELLAKLPEESQPDLHKRPQKPKH